MGKAVEVMDNDSEKINLKKEQVKWLKVLNIFLASIFSLAGLISVMSLMIYLNNTFNVSYLICLFLTFGATKVYSYFVNLLLDRIDEKRNNVLFEIEELEKEMELEKKYERLSRNSKLKLLYFARDYVSNVEKNRDDKIIQEDKFYLDNIDKVDDFSNKEINKTLIRRKN